MKHPIIISSCGKTTTRSQWIGRIINFTTIEILAPYISSKAMRELVKNLK